MNAICENELMNALELGHWHLSPSQQATAASPDSWVGAAALADLRIREKVKKCRER